MEQFSLIRPISEYAEQIAGYRQEFLDTGDSMDGTGGLRKIANPEEYIKVCKENEQRDFSTSGRVPSTQFLFIRVSDNKLIGMIDVRHRFNDYLSKFGGAYRV